MTRTYFHLLIIAILGLIVYSNTLNTPFYYDDNYNIVENYKLRDLDNLWPPSGTRWFGFLTFALNYHLGGLNTLGYHIVNLTIHIINAILVYWLVVLTFRTPFFSNQLSAVGYQHKETSIHPFTASPYFIAFFSALLFVSHPIHTQAVTYIVQRFTSLATMFYLLTIVMYIKGRIQQSAISNQPSAISRQKLEIFKLKAESCMLYAASLFSAILAMKTKEIAFTLPLVIALYDFCFLGKSSKKQLFYLLLPFFLISLIIPLERTSIDGLTENVPEVVETLDKTSQETEHISRSSYLFTQFRVISTYIRLLFLPINQNLLYDYPVYDSFFNPNVFLSFIFLLSIFGLGVYLFLKSKKYAVSSKQNSAYCLLLTPYSRLIAFGIFWFFITISVESSVIPIRHVIFEHRMYLPSIGAIVAFSSIGFYILHVINSKLKTTAYCLLPTVYCLLSTIIIVLSIATYTRNKVWKDGASLWKDVVMKSPNRPEPYNNLGNIYAEQGRTEEAIQEFRAALKINPDDPEAHTNLGSAYGNLGRFDEAIFEFKTALMFKPDYASAHNNLGLVYYKQGRLDDALYKYRVALKLKPNYIDAHNNIGSVYYKKGMWDDAIREYQIVLSLKPDHKEAQYNLSMLYAMKRAINGQMK
jgi:Tfp pilus assembly protein PilF